MTASDAITWRKSSYSETSNGCVEVGWPAVTGVAVRDSKHPNGPVLSFPTDAWHEFLTNR